MENQQNKTSENKGYVIGVLKTKNINFKNDANGKLMATGSVTVLTRTKYGVGEVKVSVLQYAITSKGKENSLFKGLETVAKEYRSIEETGSEETADFIKVEGELKDESYYSVKKGDFVDKIGIKGTFFNRLDRKDKEGNDVEPCVKVALECYIESVNPTESNELEVKFVGIGYGGTAIPVIGVIPQELVVPFQSRYQVGCTTTLNFAIVNTVEVKTEEKEVGFGEGLGMTIERTIIKNVIFGGGMVNYNGYTQDQIRQAYAKRQEGLDIRKAKAEEKEANGGSAMNTGFSAPANTGMGMGMGMGMPTGNNMPMNGFGMPTGGFGK